MFIISKILLIFLTLSTAAQAVDMKVIFSKGKVQKINLENEKVNLDKGDNLVEGDILLTGKDAFVVLKIKGHSTHKVEENSEITVVNLPYYFEKSSELDQGANLLLKAGTIFSDVVSSNGKKTLTIKSNNTVMGVRGTKLLVSRDKESKDVWLLVKTGEVEIHNELSGHKDILIKGQGLVVENDRTFTAIKRYDILKNLSWDMSPASNTNEFSIKKKLAYKEYSDKKSKWDRNEVIFGEKEKRWDHEQRDYVERTKDLKPMTIKLIRKKNVKSLITKKPKDLANGIKNKNKIRRNDFLELQKKRKIQRKLDQNDLLENRNRNRPRPKLPSTPSSIETTKPTDSSTN
jgi:hypothetical protein